MDLWTRLWGRYHVPQYVFLVTIRFQFFLFITIFSCVFIYLSNYHIFVAKQMFSIILLTAFFSFEPRLTGWLLTFLASGLKKLFGLIIRTVLNSTDTLFNTLLPDKCACYYHNNNIINGFFLVKHRLSGWPLTFFATVFKIEPLGLIIGAVMDRPDTLFGTCPTPPKGWKKKNLKIKRNYFSYEALFCCQCVQLHVVITLATSSGKRNVTVWRPSVCLSVLSAYSPAAGCDAASVHFDQTIRSTDRFVADAMK